MITSIAVSSSIIFTLKKGQEVTITIFFGIFYITGLYIHFSNESAQLANPSTAFYLSYSLALFEGLIINRIPNIIYRIICCIFFLMARWIIVPLNDDKSTIPLQIIILSLTIYIEFYQQKICEGSPFDNSEAQYKDLVANNVPQGIVIMTKDLTRCLFSNEAFNMIIETNPKTASENCLTKLNIYELHECSNITQSIDDSRSSLTLLDFLKANKQIASPGQTVCNVSYKKKTGQEPCCVEATEYIFEVKLLSLIWDDQAATGVILHDITHHNKQIQMKMIANQQKDKFLATVSHELRTPLNGIRGMVDIMKIKTDNEELHHYLKICSNCSHLLLGLVNSILDINLIRANKIKIYPEKTVLKSFLNEVVELFELQCKQKSIDLKLKMGPTVPENIVTDKNRVSQILINLIGNALKFTKEGSITISVDQSKQHKNNLRVSIEDTGIGIKDKDLCKLFQIFGKLETEGAAINHEGVGLGLSIANSLAKLLSNNEGIQVQSKFGKGSTFSFEISKNFSATPATVNKGETLCNISTSLLDEGDLHGNNVSRYKQALLPPIKHPQDNYCSQLSFRSQTPQNNKYSKSLFKNIDIRTSNFSYSSTPKRISKDDGDIIKPNKNPCVLIVDDNPLNITVAELFVRREDYQTKTALDGRTAIDMVMSNNNRMEPIRLILMDLQMPIMDGYQTTKALKEMMESKKIKEIPIVALTANDTDADRKACKEVGMCDFLSKPLSQTELARILKKYA